MAIPLPIVAACCAVTGPQSHDAVPLPKPIVRPAVRMGAEPWPLSEVRLLPGPFRDAQDRNLRWMMSLDPDRLMGHLRENAGLKPRASSYGGWDTDGNQCIGHYLTAMAHMAASTDDPAVRERVHYIVREMAECQMADGHGALYGYASDKAYFDKIGQGEVPFVNVSPWYITHKLMSGLRDAYLLCGEQEARDVLIRLADWCITVTAKLTPEQWQTMLAREYGGPHEPLADVYALTGDRRYLDLARQFTDHRIFDPLARGDARVLDGIHANTQFPKLIGWERIYQLAGDEERHRAARFFWENVTSQRSWANGGNSQYEAFFPPDEFAKKVLEPPGPETCNTYNMLRLTRELYFDDPSGPLMDYYERALLNHILASQDPETGGFAYHTPMRPGLYRTYSDKEHCFWCCFNTGMESHSKHGEMIYARARDGLYANLFIASEARWPERGLVLKQETAFPDEPATTLTLSLDRPRRFAVHLRWPGWVAGDSLAVTVNGRRVPVQGTRGQYVTLIHTWRPGDQVRVALPMAPRVEMLPHSTEYAALFYGPVLLAAPLGTAGLTEADFIATNGDQIPRKVLPVEDLPCAVGDIRKAADCLEPLPAKALTFRTAGLMRPTDVTLMPLFRLHRQRYAIYWPVRDEAGYKALAAAREAEKTAAAELEARTIDHVLIGDERSEADHGLKGERTETGPAPWPYARWRHASGWFSYELEAAPSGPTELQCVFWGGDAGRTFDVTANGALMQTVALTADSPGRFITRTFTVPASSVAGKGLTVRFTAREGSLAGGLFDLRTLKPRR